MKKRFLTLEQLETLQKAYSIRGNEFIAGFCQNETFELRHKKIEGYLIVISVEKEMDGRKTGRIKAVHTDATGKRTAIDEWEIRDDELLWISRNLSNQPISDADIIRDLNKENQQLKKKLQEITTNTPGRKTKYTRDDINKMKKMAADHISVEKIAKEFGCTRQYIYRLLKKGGV